MSDFYSQRGLEQLEAQRLAAAREDGRRVGWAEAGEALRDDRFWSFADTQADNDDYWSLPRIAADYLEEQAPKEDEEHGT